eukprot:226254-Chlamydomonas_euryale.AAC.1
MFAEGPTATTKLIPKRQEMANGGGGQLRIHTGVGSCKSKVNRVPEPLVQRWDWPGRHGVQRE